VLTLVSLPLVLAIGKARAKPGAAAPEVHAMD
jgi:hypothetical protein